MRVGSPPQHLIHPNNELIAVITSEEVRFTDAGQKLKEIVGVVGIMIPKGEQSNYGGKKIIYYQPSSPEFAKAFNKIYFPFHLKKSGFRLEIPPSGSGA